MHIEIHQPELEALIQQHMASGAFSDVDELLTKALGALTEPPAETAPGLTRKSFVELFKPVRGLLTEEEVDRLFRRDPSEGRQVDFS